MDIVSAAVSVLKAQGAPMHIQKLAEKIISEKLWTGKGKTPTATISAKIYTDIKKRGMRSPLVKISSGMIGLNDVMPLYEPELFNTQAEENTARKEKHAVHGLSFVQCAQRVLETFGHKKPMHYREITQKAIEKKWLFSGGKTPEASMYAQIINDIQRKTRKGESPLFVQHGHGYVSLSQWRGKGLLFQIEQHNAEIRKKLTRKLKTIAPEEFEKIVYNLLVKIGFEDMELTPISNDGGIDVRGTMVTGEVIKTKMAVQVKRWKQNVQSPTVQQVRGSLSAHEQGLIITTSDFSKGAQEEADKSDKTPIALMNGETFAALLMEYEIFVKKTPVQVYDFELDEENND